MSKEIIAVYQDCVLCGTKGRQKALELAQNGIIIRKVGFTTPEGKELIHKAVFENKIGTMPFYTDGQKFSTTIEDFVGEDAKKREKSAEKSAKNVKKSPEKPAKSVNKTKKTEKEGKNGTI